MENNHLTYLNDNLRSTLIHVSITRFLSTWWVLVLLLVSEFYSIWILCVFVKGMGWARQVKGMLLRLDCGFRGVIMYVISDTVSLLYYNVKSCADFFLACDSTIKQSVTYRDVYLVYRNGCILLYFFVRVPSVW